MTPTQAAGSRFERIRLWIVAAGLLLLVGAFAIGTSAILRDYDLRLQRAWNGVTGTPAGTAAHAGNVARAHAAFFVGKLLTLVVGLCLVVPRRKERGWFLVTGWLAAVMGSALVLLLATGLLGWALHSAWTAFEPSCSLDGPCGGAARALSPQAFRSLYLGLALFAALGVSAIFSLCLGLRWLLALIHAGLRHLQKLPTEKIRIN